MLVLERGRHPRPKLCAGGILMDGEYILQRLGLDCDQIPSIKVNQAYFLFEGRGICIELHPQSFRVVNREEFDSWLVNEARKRGIAVQEETCVLDVTTENQGVNIKTDKGDYFARIVIGADGTGSIVRRSIASNNNPNQSIALEVFVPPNKYQEQPNPNPNQAFFDFSVITRKVQGYIWQFPSPGNDTPACTRGIYHARVIPDNLPETLKTVLNEQLSGEEVNLYDYDLKGHPIRFFDPKGVFSAPRVILTGDAAGVDPVYGEGISFALGYGEIAATEIKAALKKEDFSFSKYRQRILRHPMGVCLKRRLQVARLLYRFKSRTIQRLLWWRFGFILKWYIEHRLIDWAKNE